MRGVFVAILAGLCTLALAKTGSEYDTHGYYIYDQGVDYGAPPASEHHPKYPYKTGEQHHYTYADKQHLHMQQQILMLYRYINQPYYYYKEHHDIVADYSIEKNMNKYTNQSAVKHFLYHYHHGMLPKGEIFSVFYDTHLEQAIALFNVFYYAHDYETFYNTAVYLHAHVNEGMFLYALSVAVTHRPDTYGVVIPPIYEVYPYYFFPSEVIQKGYHYKMQHYGEQKGVHAGYTVYANYSGYYANVHPEQSMSYYTEDVGINTYYWYYNIYYPYWMDSQHFGLDHDRRGEQYYYTYQQLLARYYLERLSNNLGQIHYIDWEQSYPVGYYPSLTYPNGMAFPQRPHYARLSDYFYNYGQHFYYGNDYAFSYSYVHSYETRIRDAIDAGYVYTSSGEKKDLFTPHGFELLASIIEGSADSPNPRYYGSVQTYARHLLGYSYQPLSDHHVAPSALEHFETSLRDPAFYSFYKHLMYYFQKYKSYLPYYKYTDLYYPGVKVGKVEFDRLVTYFDYFDSDITNAMYVSESEYQQEYHSSAFHVFARQKRLNHKPFTYKIYVSAETGGESVVKMYLGPKYDEYGRPIDIHENRVNFVQFDEFKYTLQTGENVIERSSHHNNLYASDRTSFVKFYEKVQSAYQGGGSFQVDKSEFYYGFPLRYLLPKGSYGGQAYQVYVIVTPYHAPHTYGHEDHHYDYYYPKVGTGAKYIDSYPLGYPFDRPINEQHFYVPNSYFHDVVVYHRHFDDVFESHSGSHM